MIRIKHDEHELFKNLEEHLEFINISLETEYVDNFSEDDIFRLNRFELAIKTLNSKLIMSDPILIPIKTLNDINTTLNNAMTTYKKSQFNEQDFNTLNVHTNTLLSHYSNIPLLISDDQIEDLKEVATSYRRSIGQKRSDIDKEIILIRESKTDIDKQLFDLQNIMQFFEEKIEKSMYDHEDLILTDLNNLKNQIGDIQQTSIKEQEDRNQKFSEQRNEFQDKLNNLIEDETKQVEKLIETHTESLNEIQAASESQHELFTFHCEEDYIKFQEQLAKRKTEVEEMVGALSTTSLSGHYKKVANRHWWASLIWQFLTVASLLGTVASGWYGMFFLETDNWYQFIGKVLVTGALGSLAAYTARQAKHNTVSEQRNRKLEVELKTLNPFMANFEVELQIELKKQLFPLIFGRDVEPNKSNERTRNSKSKESNVS